MKKRPFFVISLPRSRSAWLSHFLSYKQETKCGHDLLVKCKDLFDFEMMVNALDGTCETGAVAGWKLLLHMFPKSKIVVIHRDLSAIIASCRAKGVEPDVPQLIERKEMLEMLSAAPGVLSFDFAQLSEGQFCKSIFEHLLEQEFDLEWWDELRHKNIQIDMGKRIEELRSNYPRLQELTLEVMTATKLLGGAQCLGLN